MSDNLIFNPNNQNFNVNQYQGPSQKSKLAEFLIKISGGKINEESVNYIMLGILGAIILATIIVLWSSFGGGSRNTKIPAGKGGLQGGTAVPQNNISNP